MAFRYDADGSKMVAIIVTGEDKNPIAVQPMRLGVSDVLI